MFLAHRARLHDGTTSQVWAVQSEGGGGEVLHVGGRSNRAKEEFKSELDDVLNQLPEYI